MEENQSSPGQHIFDFEDQLIRAGSGKRFANYLIDLISFYVFIFFLSYVLAMAGYDMVSFIYGDESLGSEIIGRLIMLVFYGIYMGFIEAILKGRSFGKLITRTIAVNQDGTRINTSTALFRGLCRAVPFNVFSALGSPPYPWHDQWTKTYVVNYKDSSQIT